MPIHQLTKLREKTNSNRCQSDTGKLNIRLNIAVTWMKLFKPGIAAPVPSKTAKDD